MEPNRIVCPVNVLVVDDNEDIREIIAIILSRSGVQCQLAKNGVEAIERVKQCRFDAVVTDIEMPEMDGIVLTRELQKHFSELPVMIMTGKSDGRYKEMALRAGAMEFVNKPFNVSDFVTRLQRILLVRKSAQEQETREKRGPGSREAG